jgi:hypothetical protein
VPSVRRVAVTAPLLLGLCVVAACGFERFDERFSYPSGYQSTCTITLHTVVGGQASTTELDPSQFPS